MSDTSKTSKDGCQSEPRPVRKLPDVAHCRVKRSGIGDLAYCLVPEPCGCDYAEHHASDIFCFHPQRKEILARTEVRPQA
jgi:hypothetical protein